MKRKVLPPCRVCVRKREPPTRSYGGFPLIQELNGGAGQHHAPVLWHWDKHRNAQVGVHTTAMRHKRGCAFTAVTVLWPQPSTTVQRKSPASKHEPLRSLVWALMERLRPRTDENTLCFSRESYFSDSGKVNLGACECVCGCVTFGQSVFCPK